MLLLGCVFETFRKEYVKYFELDPAHFLSAPHSGWDTMLRFTGVHLKLIWGIEKNQFIEGEIRGGAEGLWLVRAMLKLIINS